MSMNLRKKMIQKNMKKYSELQINDWWDVKVGSGIFKHYNSTKQRYSKDGMGASFENSNLAQGKIPYYKVNTEIYNLIPCSSGSFKKGNNIEPDNRPAKMDIEKSFLLGETEITQELYYAVMNENPSEFKKDLKNPVEKVSWYDAVMFCNKLSDIFGLDRYYTITKSGKIIATLEKNEDYVVTMDEYSKGFRLPTEWEWEYAAKAKDQLKYSGSNNPKEVAWYLNNSNGTTNPVKKLKPNAWGFYDMTGNVSEWCENRYEKDNDAKRFRRGGNFSTSDPDTLAVAFRGIDVPQYYASHLGFRVCRYI